MLEFAFLQPTILKKFVSGYSVKTAGYYHPSGSAGLHPFIAPAHETSPDRHPPRARPPAESPETSIFIVAA
jgi:hypothetical protein